MLQTIQAVDFCSRARRKGTKVEQVEENSQSVIPKGGFCPGNPLFLAFLPGTRSLASLGITAKKLFSVATKA
jgi:hypothetical protein